LAAGSVVNPGATLGRNVIVNTCASVDHDCVLEDGVHISPGAHLGGGVTVGRGTWIGIGAVVRDHVMIGAGVTIGAGAVVVKDIPDGVMAYGVPARVVKEI
jgi:UDP-N-acetylbacillosamine N-acetyltransferase